MDLDYIAAKWQAGRLNRDDLPALASDMLEAGSDSPSLRVVAGLVPAEIDEAPEWLDKAMGELGRQPRADEWIARTLARGLACEIIDGQIDPYLGASFMWDLDLDYGPHLSEVEGFYEFVSLRFEWEELRDQQPEIEADIVAAAQRVKAALA